jgi:hypothetical protein
MDLIDHGYKILSPISARTWEPAIRDWWESVDIKNKEIYEDDLPDNFHGRMTLKDSDRAPATVHIYLQIVEGAGKTELRINVQMSVYVKSAYEFFEEFVCGLYKFSKEKDPDCELKKVELFGKKIKCDD